MADADLEDRVGTLERSLHRMAHRAERQLVESVADEVGTIIRWQGGVETRLCEFQATLQHVSSQQEAQEIALRDLQASLYDLQMSSAAEVNVAQKKSFKSSKSCGQSIDWSEHQPVVGDRITSLSQQHEELKQSALHIMSVLSVRLQQLDAALTDDWLADQWADPFGDARGFQDQSNKVGPEIPYAGEPCSKSDVPMTPAPAAAPDVCSDPNAFLLDEAVQIADFVDDFVYETETPPTRFACELSCQMEVEGRLLEMTPQGIFMF